MTLEIKQEDLRKINFIKDDLVINHNLLPHRFEELKSQIETMEDQPVKNIKFTGKTPGYIRGSKRFIHILYDASKQPIRSFLEEVQELKIFGDYYKIILHIFYLENPDYADEDLAEIKECANQRDYLFLIYQDQLAFQTYQNLLITLSSKVILSMASSSHNQGQLKAFINRCINLGEGDNIYRLSYELINRSQEVQIQRALIHLLKTDLKDYHDSYVNDQFIRIVDELAYTLYADLEFEEEVLNYLPERADEDLAMDCFYLLFDGKMRKLRRRLKTSTLTIDRSRCYVDYRIINRFKDRDELLKELTSFFISGKDDQRWDRLHCIKTANRELQEQCIHYILRKVFNDLYKQADEINGVLSRLCSRMERIVDEESEAVRQTQIDARIYDTFKKDREHWIHALSQCATPEAVEDCFCAMCNSFQLDGVWVNPNVRS